MLDAPLFFLFNSVRDFSENSSKGFTEFLPEIAQKITVKIYERMAERIFKEIPEELS